MIKKQNHDTILEYKSKLFLYNYNFVHLSKMGLLGSSPKYLMQILIEIHLMLMALIKEEGLRKLKPSI